MNITRTLMNAVSKAVGVKIIRADQKGALPVLPYATYKVISDRGGVGRETIDLIDLPNRLDEHVEAERVFTVSINVYGKTHWEAQELATKLRQWFMYNRSAEFCEENNIAFASVNDVENRTIFITDSYDERFGFDVSVRYIDTDQYEIDYFEKVEYEIEIEKE